MIFPEEGPSIFLSGWLVYGVFNMATSISGTLVCVCVLNGSSFAALGEIFSY